jgi:AraC-like DNA-binding protein
LGKIAVPQIAREIASGPGWHVNDVVCTDGPNEPVIAERHDNVCIAAVLGGAFRYRGSLGEALMAPGSMLLGNHGQCFECGHEHGQGDHCISFHFQPEFVEAVAGAMPGTRSASFSTPKLAPSEGSMPLFAEAGAARETGDRDALEELAYRFAGYAIALQAETRPFRGRIEEEHAVALSTREIEADVCELESPALSLAALAARAGMDPYRFLRLFRRVIGVTPHQYVLHLRLTRAAEWLISRDDEVSAIAFEAGFNDLSTFNHRFRRVMGITPSAWRARAGLDPEGGGHCCPSQATFAGFLSKRGKPTNR